MIYYSVATMNKYFRDTIIMRFPVRFLLPVIFAFSLSSAFAKDYQMGMVGEFHGDEINFIDGDKVFSFDNSRLEEVTVKVEIVRDTIVDKDEEKTGKLVSLSGEHSKRNFWLLLKGDFKEGNVEVTNLDKEKCFPKEFTEERHGPTDRQTVRIGNLPKDGLECKFSLSGKEHTLRVTKYIDNTLQESGKDIDFEITDDRGNKSNFKGVSGIAWLGDLNRDGRLDLILDYNQHYNVSSAYSLFLSTEKESEGPVKVASFMAVGC